MISVLNCLSSETVILYIFSPSIKQRKDCHEFIGFTISGHEISNKALARLNLTQLIVLILFVIFFTHSSKL